jgi:hypothetical protein
VGGPTHARTAGLSLLSLVVPAVVGAQGWRPNRATVYLYPSDVTDARALWVNPAGSGRLEEASVNLDLTVGEPGAAGRLRQLTLGLSSRGLSFGYQRDVFDAGARGHTYRIGYAAGRAGLAAGFVAALYRGGTSSSGWDVGIHYDWRASLSLAGVIENVGRPSVRGTTLPITYVPSATLRLFDARAALSADGRFTSGGVLGYAFGLRASLGATTRAPVGLLARLDTDRALRRAGLAFGVSLGSQDLAGLVATTPGDAGGIDAVDLYGVSTRRFARSRSVRD